MQEQTGVEPPALQNRPALPDRLQPYVVEFSGLSRDRRYTEAGPLPLTTLEIRVYWQCFIRRNFDDFHQYMVTIDNIWLDAAAKKAEKRRAKPKEAPARRSPR